MSGLRFKNDDEYRKWLQQVGLSQPDTDHMPSKLILPVEKQKKQVVFNHMQRAYNVEATKKQQQDWPIEFLVLWVVCAAVVVYVWSLL